MTELGAQLVGGLLLGLAGAVHCACMCGGITTATLSFFSIGTRAQMATTLSMIFLGRILAYASLGLLVGGGAAFAADLTAVPAPSNFMPLLGAIALMWIGFSTAGLLPAYAGPSSGPSTLGTRGFGVGSLIDGLRRRFPSLAPIATGVGWGFAPCPLIYSALFLAMLTGSMQGGLIWMLGFGLGTVPAVLLSSLGINYLRTINLKPLVRTSLGLAIAGLGFASVYFDLGLFDAFCAAQ